MTKRILFILMPEKFQDKEFNVPYTMLKEKGYVVDIAGLKPGEAVGAFGLKVTPNKVIDQEPFPGGFERYDALVIPGGPGSTKYLWGNTEVQKIVRLFREHNKVIAAICHACVVPAEAGILTGKKATVYPTDDAKAIFHKHKVTFVDEGVVRLPDDNIITAQGPTFASDFGQAIIEMVEKKQ